MVAYIWITLGVVAGAFSLFAVPHGFRLLDQQRKANSVDEINIHGDFVNGNKIVTETQVNINSSDEMLTNGKVKIDVAKLRINRAFEDFAQSIDSVSTDFLKESEAVANQYNMSGNLSSGRHINAQMDLSISTKKKLDQEYDGLKRKIEDILVEVLNKTSLQSAGADFEFDQKRIDAAQNRCEKLYPLLNDNPKSWEMRVFKEIQLTKDFDVTNDLKN